MARHAAGGRICPHYVHSEEEGVGGPPAQALGEREQHSRQWIASLAEGDRVNAAPPPVPGATGSERLLRQLSVRGG